MSHANSVDATPCANVSGSAERGTAGTRGGRGVLGATVGGAVVVGPGSEAGSGLVLRLSRVDNPLR